MRRSAIIIEPEAMGTAPAPPVGIGILGAGAKELAGPTECKPGTDLRRAKPCPAAAIGRTVRDPAPEPGIADIISGTVLRWPKPSAGAPATELLGRPEDGPAPDVNPVESWLCTGGTDIGPGTGGAEPFGTIFAADAFGAPNPRPVIVNKSWLSPCRLPSQIHCPFVVLK